MAALILPSVRTVQPQGGASVDRADDLLGAWIPGLGDVARLRSYTPSLGHVITRHGSAWDTKNATAEHEKLDLGSEFVPAGGGFSLLVSMRYGSAIGTGQGVGVRAGGTVGKRAAFNFASGATNFDFGGATAGATRISQSGLITADGTHAIYLATTGQRGMELWLNGSLIASNAANPSRTATTTDAFAVGDCYGGTSGLGDYAMVSAWGAQLPKYRAEALSRNPWKLFTPITRRIWVPVSAGGLSTITQAVGVSTTGALSASATAAAILSASAGSTTAASIESSAISQATLTSAAGSSSASILAASSAASAVVASASGASTAETIAGSSLTTGASSLSIAVGTSMVSVLSGESITAGEITSSAGVTTAETLTGSIAVNIVSASIADATGATSAAVFASSAVAASVAIAAAGASSAAVIASNGILVIAGAMAGNRSVQDDSRPQRLQDGGRSIRLQANSRAAR